jgi:hypothetical protein
VRVLALLPGVLGVALIATGAALIYPPAGLLAIGAALLVLDRRL